MPADVIDRIRTGRAAGVLLFADNLAERDRALDELQRLQGAATASPGAAPAIVATDQEGGIVARIPGPPGVPAAEMGTWPADRIRAEAADTASNLLAWGINTDLAPVSDVARPGSFLDDQQRSFSSDPEVAAEAVAAFVAGLHDGGVAATLKHAPGLGAASINTDDAISSVDLTLDELRRTDLVPVRAGIEAGADLVMVSSAIYPAVDDLPPVLSPTWIHSLARDELAYDGVVVSDALDTPSLEPYGSLGEIAVAAARAGVDLLIAADPTACGTMQAALRDAIESGVLPLDAAIAAADRVRALRSRLR